MESAQKFDKSSGNGPGEPADGTERIEWLL
jgi:hypothetical protein